MTNLQTPKIGISTCLIGREVRYDAGHKHNRYLTDVLGRHVRFAPVCPEIEVGMGVPREAVQLEGVPESPRMIGTQTGIDWTVRMNRYSKRRVRQKDIADLCGFILKSRSPSCGMKRVKLYAGSGSPQKKAGGLFARALMDRYPYLPIEEEDRLSNAGLRENFIVRVFAYNRLRQLYSRRFNQSETISFHTAHKYLLLAHSPKLYGEFGRLVAAIKKIPPAEFKDSYRALFMEALRFKATVKKNVNVLQHITGSLRDHLSAAERKNVADAIANYEKEAAPLVVPITLIRHFASIHNIAYIRDQIYLSPHPKELMLRNHV